MTLMPSTSQKFQNSICALINDRDSSLLAGLIDRLGGSLENGALIPLEENTINVSRHYQIRLDTKYYMAEVPVFTFPTFEALLSLLKLRSGGEDIQIRALIVCAKRNELKTEFLARIAQCLRELDLEFAEVKALILNENGLAIENDADAMDMVNDIQLQKFCIQKSIELIPIKNGGNSPNSVDDVDEEGATGLARIVEILETVKWPGMRMKPNPLNLADHLNRLRQFIQAEQRGGDIYNNGFGSKLDRRPRKSKESPNFDNDSVRKSDYSKIMDGGKCGIQFDDYPDSEDEEAIMELFDKSRSELANSRTNKEQRKAEGDRLNAKASNFASENEERRMEEEDDMCRELAEHFGSEDPLQLGSILGSLNMIRQQNSRQMSSLGERVAAASEGLTYSVLGASPSSTKPQSQRQKQQQEIVESTENGPNAAGGKKMMKK